MYVHILIKNIHNYTDKYIIQLYIKVSDFSYI